MESRQGIVDSSVLVAFFRGDDSNHQRAVEFMEKIDSFAISDYILLEVTTVLQQKVGLELTRKAVEFLVNNRDVELLSINNQELGDTLALFFEQKFKLSFVDCSILVLAKNRGLIVSTLDDGMIKAGKWLNESSHN